MVNGRRRQDARGVNEMSGAGCAQICGACVETVGEGKEQEWERSERCVVCSVWSVCKVRRQGSGEVKGNVR